MIERNERSEPAVTGHHRGPEVEQVRNAGTPCTTARRMANDGVARGASAPPCRAHGASGPLRGYLPSETLRLAGVPMPAGGGNGNGGTNGDRSGADEAIADGAAQRAGPSAGGQNVFSPEHWVELGQTMRLCSRELEIVRYVFDDRKERTIAEELGISPHTVNTYLQRLYRKLNVGSRPQLIVKVVAAHLKIVAEPAEAAPIA